MGKYQALGDHLRSHGGDHIRLTFDDVEHIIGSSLPRSKRYPAWWSNNPLNNPMTKVWLEAGYRTEQVDIERGTLMFSRADNGVWAPTECGSSGAEMSRAPDVSSDERSRPPLQPRRHPAFGALKDVTWIAPDTDLTEPADPDWAAHVERPDWRP